MVLNVNVKMVLVEDRSVLMKIMLKRLNLMKKLCKKFNNYNLNKVCRITPPVVPRKIQKKIRNKLIIDLVV